MKLGFHYHTPAIIAPDGIYVSGVIGVFIDSMANECNHLTLFLHTPLGRDSLEIDYKIKAENVSLVTIGMHLPLYFRLIFNPIKIRSVRKEIQKMDLLLVRSPTPLMFEFVKIFDMRKITIYLVSDYLDNSQALNLTKIRKYFVIKWAEWFQTKLIKLIPKVNVVTNSMELKNKFDYLNKSISIVRTSTLSDSTFFIKDNSTLNSEIQLLYTGRIDLSKGLIEMLEAMAVLREKGVFTTLSIAGWDTHSANRNYNDIVRRAKQLELLGSINFLGKKEIGDELNNVYRNAS